MAAWVAPVLAEKRETAQVRAASGTSFSMMRERQESRRKHSPPRSKTAGIGLPFARRAQNSSTEILAISNSPLRRTRDAWQNPAPCARRRDRLPGRSSRHLLGREIRWSGSLESPPTDIHCEKRN